MGEDVPCTRGTLGAESSLAGRRKTLAAQPGAFRHPWCPGTVIKVVMVSKGVNAMKRTLFRNSAHFRRFVAAAVIVFFAVLLADWPFGGKVLSQNEKSQPPAAAAARPDDVKSVDAIIAAVYDAISGPAGERDWDRLRSLFLPEARLIACFSLPRKRPSRRTRHGY